MSKIWTKPKKEVGGQTQPQIGEQEYDDLLKQVENIIFKTIIVFPSNPLVRLDELGRHIFQNIIRFGVVMEANFDEHSGEDYLSLISGFTDEKEISEKLTEIDGLKDVRCTELHEQTQYADEELKQKVQNIIEAWRKPKNSIVGVVYDEEMLLHRSYVENHPECPERISAIHLNLIKKNLWENLIKIECHPAKESDLSLVHDKAHIEKITNSKYDYELSKDNVRIELDKYKNQN